MSGREDGGSLRIKNTNLSTSNVESLCKMVFSISQGDGSILDCSNSFIEIPKDSQQNAFLFTSKDGLQTIYLRFGEHVKTMLFNFENRTFISYSLHDLGLYENDGFYQIETPVSYEIIQKAYQDREKSTDFSVLEKLSKLASNVTLAIPNSNGLYIRIPNKSFNTNYGKYLPVPNKRVQMITLVPEDMNNNIFVMKVGRYTTVTMYDPDGNFIEKRSISTRGFSIADFNQMINEFLTPGTSAKL